jgi:hypothetical protein
MIKRKIWDANDSADKSKQEHIRVSTFHGRAVAQVVSRCLPTAAALVRVRAECGVCGGQSGTGAGFLRILRFHLPIILPISPSSYLPGADTIGLMVAALPSGPNWNPLPTMPIKNSTFHKKSIQWQQGSKSKNLVTTCILMHRVK